MRLRAFCAIACVVVGVVASGCCCPCSYVGGVDVAAGTRFQDVRSELPPQVRANSTPLR